MTGLSPSNNIPTREDLNKPSVGDVFGGYDYNVVFRDPDTPGVLYYVDGDTNVEHAIGSGGGGPATIESYVQSGAFTGTAPAGAKIGVDRDTGDVYLNVGGTWQPKIEESEIVFDTSDATFTGAAPAGAKLGFNTANGKSFEVVAGNWQEKAPTTDFVVGAVPLTGAANPGEEFGVDTATQKLYYVNGAGNWVELPGDSSILLVTTDPTGSAGTYELAINTVSGAEFIPDGGGNWTPKVPVSSGPWYRGEITIGPGAVPNIANFIPANGEKHTGQPLTEGDTFVAAGDGFINDGVTTLAVKKDQKITVHNVPVSTLADLKLEPIPESTAITEIATKALIAARADGTYRHSVNRFLYKVVGNVATYQNDTRDVSAVDADLENAGALSFTNAAAEIELGMRVSTPTATYRAIDTNWELVEGILAPPPPAALSTFQQDFLDYMLTPAYQARLDLYTTTATIADKNDQLYNGQIFFSPDINAWMLSGDNQFVQRFLDTAMAILGLATNTVGIDETGGLTNDNGVTLPQSLYGAGFDEYPVWFGASRLDALQFCASACASAHRVLRSSDATVAHKATARTIIETCALHVGRCATTESYGPDMNQRIEQGAVGQNQFGTPIEWGDQEIILGTAAAYIDKWYTAWGKTLPQWLRAVGQNKDTANGNVPVINFRSWWADRSGATVGDNSLIYALPKINGMDTTAGYVQIPNGPSIQDVFHAARDPAFAIAVCEAGGITDPDAAARIPEVLTAYGNNIDRIIIDNGSGCTGNTVNIDGTGGFAAISAHRPTNDLAYLGIGDEPRRDKFRELVENGRRSSGDPCYTLHAPESLANMWGWVALGDSAERSDVYDAWGS